MPRSPRPSVIRSARYCLVPAAVATLAVGALTAGCGSPAASGSTGDAAIALDRPVELSRFHRQVVNWHACSAGSAGSQDETGKALDAAGARCGEVIVPLDYRRPEGRTITVAVARRPATDRTHRLGTLIVNMGGPSPSLNGVLAVLQGLKPEMAHGSPTVAARYDLVGMDPRFFGHSTALGCDWPTGAAVRTANLAAPDRQSFTEHLAGAKELAARCTGVRDLLPHASTRNIARDMDVVRAVLGEKTVSYLGWSYGGYLGAVYAELFPRRVDRMVLDSSPDPDVYGPDKERDTGAAANMASLQDWARWAARRHATYRLGSTAGQVLATVEGIRRQAAARGLMVGSHRIDARMLPGLLLTVVDTEEAYALFSAKVQVLNNAARGLAVTPTADLTEYLGLLSSTDVTPEFGFSAGLAVRCADRAAPRDPETYFRDIQAHLRDEALYGPLTRKATPCTFWPTDPVEAPIQVRSDVPALLIAASGDPASPYSGQQALHRALTRSRLATLNGAFRHGVYLFDGNTCIDTTVDQYMIIGSLPRTDITCTRG